MNKAMNTPRICEGYLLYILINKLSLNCSISDDNVNKSIAFSKIKTYY